MVYPANVNFLPVECSHKPIKLQDQIIHPSAAWYGIDIGNTHIKTAAYQAEEWVWGPRFRTQSPTELVEWINTIEKDEVPIVISSVVSRVTELLVSEVGRERLAVITRKDLPREMLHYQTPETLGLDRVLAGLGASAECETAAVVIDAGSTCTIDVMDANGCFCGGVIAPGLRGLETGIATLAPELPRVHRTLPSQFPGKSTDECLRWGILGSFLGIVTSQVKRLETEYAPVSVYLTGGDAPLLAEHLPDTFIVDPFLVMKGLKALHAEARANPD